ncbi:MAG: transcriptional repressor [Spirochaetales bacterium]|nr:transcriptional repressor [Spirochaetales bacterium]
MGNCIINDNKTAIFNAFLKTKWLKLTWELEKILQKIMEMDEHFLPEDLIQYFEQAGNERISRATVYRTLKLLEEASIINSFHINDDFKKYERIKAHHDHMICNECGKIIEFYDERLERIQKEICDEYGFKADSHIMNITGKCIDCRNKR